MVVGERLKAIRQIKNLSQGDVQERTGLLRAYISRVENGHTVPSIETLEKITRALEIPLYQLFYDGDEEPRSLKLPKVKIAKLSSTDAKVLTRLRPLLGKIKNRDKRLLLAVARKMSAAR